MLSQFSVKNYKSIKDVITLDMQPAMISEHEERIIKLGGENGDAAGAFLPIAVIYGPNGGGKSNILEAINALNAKILRAVCAICDDKECEYKGKKIPIEPFRFSDTTKAEPTEFEIFFRTESAEYRYILHIRKDTVIYERLDRIKLGTGRRSGLFERTGNNISLKGAFSRFKISDDISENLPFLSYLGIAYGKNDVVADVFSWFEFGIDFLNYGNPLQELKMAIVKSDNLKQLFLKMIKEMDLDIEDFRIEEKDDALEVYAKHIVDGYASEISLAKESSGTKKLFGLLPFIADSLVSGSALVIDELDAKLHPVLLKYIIELYISPLSNKKAAQLIFTSHDLSTMNSDLFRRDEIWFAAKGNKQNTKLYSLVEFKHKNGESVRKDARFDKQYLEGKYGADPYLRRLIDWGDLSG